MPLSENLKMLSTAPIHKQSRARVAMALSPQYIEHISAEAFGTLSPQPSKSWCYSISLHHALTSPYSIKTKTQLNTDRLQREPVHVSVLLRFVLSLISPYIKLHDCTCCLCLCHHPWDNISYLSPDVAM